MVKDIVVSALGFSVGIALVSGFYHARGMLQDKVRVFYVMSRWGYAVAFGLLLEALLKAPIVESSWRTWVFVVACVLVSIGFAGVAITDHRDKTRFGRHG